MFGSVSNNSIEDCFFINNTSTNDGGALYLFLPSDLTITGCYFSSNNALDGSAIYYEETNLKTLILNSSFFYQNVAWENGAALFISGSSTVIIENCNFTENSIQINEQNIGSVLYLNNPGNLSIISCNFEFNEGIVGTCIYYSETSYKYITNKKLLFLIIGDNALLSLTNNYFYNNFAFLGGGAIYFQNKLLAESPYHNNIFTNNTAFFANDFFTFPVRLEFTDNNYSSRINKTTYSINVVPGITMTSLYFDVVDYYGQTIKSMNGGLLFIFINLI